MSNANTSGDSSELEALFDSIASTVSFSAPPAPVAAAPVPQSAQPAGKKSFMQQVGEAEDSSDLQTLFDSIAAKQGMTAGLMTSPLGGESAWPSQSRVFQQLGKMTRLLHDTLGNLGFEKLFANTVTVLPDAKDRLAYIANLTEQAACKVLNATDVANPLQDELENGAALLAGKWEKLYANQMSVDEFKLLAAETTAYLRDAVPKRTEATKAQLMEIIMAQDFQDLTGQVIKKIVAVAHELESQLMDVLIETMPGEKRTESVNTLLNGPVINAAGRTDVVASQQQVDELLESLGF